MYLIWFKISNTGLICFIGLIFCQRLTFVFQSSAVAWLMFIFVLVDVELRTQLHMEPFAVAKEEIIFKVQIFLLYLYYDEK